MFGRADIAEMPESFLTDPAAWDVFVGQVWHSVLSPLNLSPQANVIEIAPGSAAKIGHALAALDFRGTLHIVEPSAAALEKLLPLYRRLLPHATLYTHTDRLESCLDALPRHTDTVLGNHIIDDFLLGAAAQSSATFDWALQYSDTIAQETRTAYAQLSTDDQNIAAQVAQTLHTAIAHLSPRHVVLSQYPSATLRDNGLETLNTLALTTLDILRKKIGTSYVQHDCSTTLGAIPHYHNAHIGINVLNPRHWLSCTHKN